MKSKFIVIDGGDGSGKTTQLKLIQEYFGDKIIMTREPGGSPYAEEIRELILHSSNAHQADGKTMYALFWASRSDHLKNTVIPNLESGKHVISSRFDCSTYAYQMFGQKIEGLTHDQFMEARDFFVGDCKPDMYIFLDVDAEVGLKRKGKQKPDRLDHFEKRDIDFHNSMRKGYKEFFKYVPHKIIDANRSIEEISKDLIKSVEEVIES